MTIKSIFTSVLLIIVCLMPLQFVGAQEVPAMYIVTSSQAVNARSCPRLSCGVLKHFAPGETFYVSDVVEGETVTGSRQWLQVEDSKTTMYVHSSLATPSPNGSPNPAGSMTSTEVNTDDWTDHNTDTFSVKASSDFYAGAELLADEKLLGFIAKGYQDPEGFVASIRDNQKNADLFLLNPIENIWVSIGHDDVGKAGIALHVLQENMIAAAKENGADVLSEAIVVLPAGSAVRLDLNTTATGNHSEPWKDIVYALVSHNRLYYLDFNGSASTISSDEPIINTIVSSFQVNAPLSGARSSLLGDVSAGRLSA
ncbi:MAG: hypothetical protein ABI700_02335 [Chloroflexota bacterium]